MSPLTIEDIPAAMRLVEAAGWNQTPADWQRVIEYQPWGCFKATLDGQLVGTVTSTSYGRELAWIGMMLVDPSVRRQGIGSGLMQQVIAALKARQTNSIKLDATPAGKPVYEKLGFVAQFDFHRWCRPATDGNGVIPLGTSLENPVSVAALMALDRTAFGVDRQVWLNEIAKGRSCAVEASGFGMIRPGRVADYLGPITASSFETARILITRLVQSTSATIYWDMPQNSAALQSLARDLAFEPVRVLTRMALGDDSTRPDLSYQFAICDPAVG